MKCLIYLQKHDAETLLWKAVYYRPIEEFRCGLVCSFWFGVLGTSQQAICNLEKHPAH